MRGFAVECGEPLFQGGGWEWPPKLVKKIEEKTKEKQGGSRVAGTIKMAWNVESAMTRKKCCGEVKIFFFKAAAWRNRREAGRADCDI